MKIKSFGKEFEKWLINYKKKTIRDSSYLRYTVALKLFQRYDISNVNVADLQSWHVQDYINNLVEDEYSMETIYKQYKLIKEFVDYAINEDMMYKPICSQVRLPNKCIIKTSRRNVVAYEASEQEALKNVLRTGENQAYYAAILMLETGMRAGEVLALFWDDVNWSKRCLRISKTIVKGYDNNHAIYIQNTAKSDSSNRVIPLSKEAMSVLETMRSLDMSGNEKIFHTRDGEILSYDHLRYWIRKACKEANVPYRGQHVFRHTFATNCYYKGCEVKVLSKFLGHSNSSITYNTYIHLYRDALEDMRKIID